MYNQALNYIASETCRNYGQLTAAKYTWENILNAKFKHIGTYPIRVYILKLDKYCVTMNKPSYFQTNIQFFKRYGFVYYSRRADRRFIFCDFICNVSCWLHVNFFIEMEACFCIFDEFMAFSLGVGVRDLCCMHTMIGLTEGNAKCRHLKKFTYKGTFGQVFICLRPSPVPPSPPPFLHVYTCIQERGNIVHKSGSKIPT